MDVPVEVVVADELGNRALLGEDAVDQRDGIVAVGEQQLAQPRSQRLHRPQFLRRPGFGTGVPPCVVEGPQIAKGGHLRIDQRNGRPESLFHVRSENHIDTLPQEHVVSGVMSTDTPDVQRTSGAGIALALTSAVSFGLSGSLARALMDTGWSPAAAVAMRVTIAALVLVIPGLMAVRGQFRVLLTNARTIVIYGLLAVAGAQFLYFLAVSRLDVGVALLIEYTAPVAVVLFMWAFRGQKPGPLTFVGAAIAAVGLVLLLDVLSGTSVDALGVLFALGAMIGAATYFVISADDSSGLPPITLAAGGLVFAAVAFWLAALVGVLPMTMSASPVTFTLGTVPWWLPVLALGLVTAALAYVTGIAAARHLGSRLASFVALSEVAAGLVFAWILLDQQPKPLQLLGAFLVLGGVVVVKLGERDVLESGIDDLLVDVVPAEHEPHGC